MATMEVGGIEFGTGARRRPAKRPDGKAYRICVLGDFGGKSGAARLGPGDPAKIDDVMTALGVAVDLPGGGRIELRSIDELHPDRLIDRLPLPPASPPPAASPEAPPPEPDPALSTEGLFDAVVSETSDRATTQSP